ncbi:uncharacterized protein A1O9_03232 [Exophiala aquamarina CBS 119918]|uniref:Major facilitator superfamily (MFS) profile domain-containing protein n=1 Tax=Exophiala aquamarina CBS 119918 TaxID=1182545 RepID=A0A072PNK2_9EURO|nr:uncharacterized protein A1O9_03232 [Exophiala aquamarina CBS 119918]KEF61664.1 hypothetical protein A1O9_03232 [Exophiala aquamarina CBS 119918]
MNKQDAVALAHLEKVDSKDSQHRNELGEDATQLEGYWSSPRLLGSLLATILLANSLYIGYGMPTNVLSVINADIGPSPNIYLISLVYTLFTGVLHLFFSRLSDILGRRYFLIGGQFVGVVGSVICATGNTVNVLVGGSVLAGIGGAAQLLYPIIIHELIPNKHRHWAQAGVTLSVLPTLGFGPAIARTMIAQTSMGWRGVYWLNVAVSGASVLLYLTCYFPPNFHMINSELTKWQEVKTMDYGGLFLYFSGLILVLLGFTWAQGIYAWNSAHVITSLVVGSLVLVAFAIYEIYMPLKQPLLPVKLFKIPNITACVVVGSTMQMVWLALNIFWPLQINMLFTTDEVTIGLLSCTTGIALTAGELIFAPLFRGIGHLKWQVVAASLMTAVFGTAMAAVTYKTEKVGIAFTILAGLAVGWIELVTIVITGLVAPPNDIGVAQGFFSSIRLVFGTIAVSIYLAIYSNRLTAFLPQEIVPAVQEAGLPTSSVPDLFVAISNGTSAALENVPGMTEVVVEALGLATKHAYAHSFKVVYLATIAFTGLGLIASFWIVDVSSFLTNYVNKTIHRPKITKKAQEDV